MNRGSSLVKSFEALRFYLIIGVVFIHNYATTAMLNGENVNVSRSVTPILAYSSDLFSQVLGRLSVPLFFLISGYLFFYNVEQFDKQIYYNKLKKRMRSLLIPYLIWNIIYLLFGIIRSSVSVSDLSIGTFIEYLWNFDPDSLDVFPIAYPFWYIRDLMVVVLFSPLVYHFKDSILLLIVGITFFLLNVNIPYLGMRGFSTEAFCFFFCGSYLALNRNTMWQVSKVGRWYLSYLYLLFVIFDLVTKGENYNIYIHRVGILLGVAYLMFIFGRVILKKIKTNSFLSKASFFIFAVHAMLLPIVKKIFLVILSPQSDFDLAVLYFAHVAITVTISLLIYWFIKKYAPVPTRVITGGR